MTGAQMYPQGTFGCLGDPLGNPSAELLGSHPRWPVPTTRDHMDTVWSNINPYLQAACGDPSHSPGIRVLGVGEHVRHHQDQRLRGQRELTCIVDLARRTDHSTARLLDLVPARSGSLYNNLLADRGETFSQVSKLGSSELSVVGGI